MIPIEKLIELKVLRPSMFGNDDSYVIYTEDGPKDVSIASLTAEQMSVANAIIELIKEKENKMELDKAYELVLADLEDRNSHTIGRLVAWDRSGSNENTKENELMYRTWLLAKNFVYGGLGRES